MKSGLVRASHPQSRPSSSSMRRLTMLRRSGIRPTVLGDMGASRRIEMGHLPVRTTSARSASSSSSGVEASTRAHPPLLLFPLRRGSSFTVLHQGRQQPTPTLRRWNSTSASSSTPSSAPVSAPSSTSSSSASPKSQPEEGTSEEPPTPKEPFLVRTKNYWRRPWSHYSWQQQVFVLGVLASPLYAYYKRDDEFREVVDYWYENAGQEALYWFQNHILINQEEFVSDEDLADEEEQLIVNRELERERKVDYLLAKDPPKPVELASAQKVKDIVFPWDWPTVKYYLLYPWRPVENDLPPPPSESTETGDGVGEPSQGSNAPASASSSSTP